MIQYFQFDKETVQESEFSVISGKTSTKFFIRKCLYLIMIVYSTFFLAVAIPFVNTPFLPIYFIGALLFIYYGAKLAVLFLHFREFKNGKLKIGNDAVEITANGKVTTINTDEISGLELNLLGVLIIKKSSGDAAFPVSLLPGDESDRLLSMFRDTAPGRTRIIRKIWEFFDAVSVALILAVHIIQFIIQAYFIPTGSMMDTLRIGDHLFVEKITYGPIIPQMLGMNKPVHVRWLGIREIRRGDIVIFRPPHETDKDYIKRCVAVPGDKLEIRDGALFINGARMDESAYVKGETHDYSLKSKVQGIVPEGKVVVFGDNRENSMDSRYFGYLDIDKIKGKAFFLYWNTEQIRKFDFSRIGLIR